MDACGRTQGQHWGQHRLTWLAVTLTCGPSSRRGRRCPTRCVRVGRLRLGRCRPRGGRGDDGSSAYRGDGAGGWPCRAGV